MRIRVLGGFAVEVGRGELPSGSWRLRRARHLVALLALTRDQRAHREVVLEALWPGQDPGAATHGLHQAMYVARRALQHGDEQGVLTLAGEEVILSPGRQLPVDALQFEDLSERALAADDARLLAQADALYRGDLLPELRYADWTSERREALRRRHQAVLVGLARLSSGRPGGTDQALLLLDRVLQADPVHEGAVRTAMELLVAAGRRSEALSRYERLQDELLVTFGTDPDPATTRLFRTILNDADPATASPSPVRRLPVYATSFVGRSSELEQVRDLLAHEHLVTLTGPGGSGKTRLAVRAAEPLPARAHGTWFVDLSALSDPTLVADVVAGVLELTPGAGDDRFHALAQQLTTWHALLIVDTCEHLLDSCARLADTLLSHCPGVRLLMTSREPLHASGEATFRVPSLELPPLPEPGAEPTVEELARCASVQLFVDRARHVRADFVLDEDNCAAVAALCRGLDGVPLAIELAAARVAMLTPYEILLRLGDALALLAGGTRRVTRHATLRAALTWSYELLDPSEQALLRRLSAFSGGVDLPSAEAVCGEPPLAHEVLDVVARLVSKSLLLAVPGPGGTRYRMLDTVRQLGAEKLAESDEAEALRARHCAHYLALARRHDPEHGRELGAEGVAILEREHDNLRAALRWAIDAEPTAAVALCASLWRFWFLRCHVVEGAEWVERALAAPLPPSRSRAEALLGLTGLDARRGRSQRIRFHAADAVAVMEQLDDPAATMLYRLVQATLEWATHDVAEAERIAAEVDRVSEGLGRTDMRAGASWIRAHCALTREDADAADRLLEDCRAQLDEVDPDAAPFITVVTPCVVLIPVADLMVPSYEESLLVGRRVGARHAVAHLWSARGYAARLRGDYGAARAAVSRSLHQFERLRDPLGRAQALNHLGCILRDDQVFDDAEDCLQEAEGIRHRIGDRRGEWITRANAGMSRVRRGDVATGESWTRACLAAFEAVEDMPSVANMKGALGTIALASGDSTRARTLYARAVTDLVHQSWPRVEAWYRVMVAELAVAEGLGAEADSQLDEASTLLRLQRSQAAQARVTRARDRLAAR